MIDLESPDGTICLELVKKLQDAGFRFAEVPVHHYHRTYGKSSSSISGASAASRRLGDDWFPYGLKRNRKPLDTFLRYHYEQGLSKRRFKPEELFVPETMED